MQGRIIKQISNDYTVLSNGMKYICKARGKFRNEKKTPLVGDIVEFDEKNFYILKILPRKNRLIRPSVANVDQAVVITSVKRPDFSTNLLDKLLTIIEFNKIRPILIFTKLDLLEKEKEEEIMQYISYYRKIGYDCFINTDIEQIKSIFADKVSVFTGQTGAGKSTLLNHLDTSLHLDTNEISESLGRGKHTTRHTELLTLLGGMIADTPGFSSIDFYGMKPIDIRDNFRDFNLYRDACKYRDCLHDKEDACVIKAKVKEKVIMQSRYDNYIKFIHEKTKNRWDFYS